MGWLLGGAADVSPPLRLQVFDVAARVLQAHWQSLRDREEELSNLLQLLAYGLARPSDVEPFRRCLGAFETLWQLALRPQQRRADASPWLKQRASEWLLALMTLRLDQTHAALHAEVTQLLHAALVTDVGQMEPAQRPAELLPLLQRSLAATAGMGDDERRELLETFSQNDVRDFSTFKLCTDRLANDVAYLQKRRRACLQQQQAVM